MNSLIAAIQSGADAIYLGGKEFSARASAANFSREELIKAVRYAHLRGVKIYVTVNTILTDKELSSSLEYIYYLYRIGVDALIVQDLGMVRLIRYNWPNMPLHASTQMTINNLAGAKLLEDTGFSRVVLARETELSEITKIREYTNLEVEFFGHGALCVSYSGQCLMSSMIGGRSGNRGRCAQPCRKSYQLVRDEHLTGDEGYLLSPKDLYTLEDIDQLISSGITTLKLEGRMKRPDYVAAVTDYYRRAIDNQILDYEEAYNTLSQVFNRGFTKGIPLGDRGENFSNTDRPDNRGVIVGKVLNQNRGNTQIDIDIPLSHRDVIEFDTRTKPRTMESPRDLSIGSHNITVPFDVEIGPIRRIIDTTLKDKYSQKSRSNDRTRGLDLSFIAQLGDKPTLIINSGQIKVQVTSDQVVESASKHPMTKEKIIEQLDRLGGSDYHINNVIVDIDEGIFLPVSTINELRRDGISKWEDKFISSYQRSSKAYSFPPISTIYNPKEISISLSFSNKSQIKDVDFSGVDKVYLRFLDKTIYKNLMDKGLEVYYRPPKIQYSEDYLSATKILQNIDHTGIVAENIGHIKGYGVENIIGGMGLNIYNSQAIDKANELGVDKVILSPELTLDQINSLITASIPKEVIAYGFLEVMTMKHCPFSTIKGCTDDSKCSICEYRTGHSLRDQLGVDFKVDRIDKYSYLYNSYPISMASKMEQLLSSGISSVLLDFTIEENPNYIIQSYKDAINGHRTDVDDLLKEKYKDITYGHYYRGID